MNKTLIWIIVIILIVVGGIWISGYLEASKLVSDGNASLLTVGIYVRDMNGLKKSGFMTYITHNTDYRSHVNGLKDMF